jgi:DNA-binding response OmpR family regulator
MSRILVIEDDPAIVRGLQHALEYERYEVITARNGEEGLEAIRSARPDLVVLDVMLPVLSGFEVCRRARREGIRTPILMLTARGDEVDQVMGLDLGADDYVRKPFSVPMLLARMRALLRRTTAATTLPAIIEFDDVRVDFESFEASKGGRAISLAPKEFAVLRHLVAREGKVVRRDELLQEAWGFEQMPTTRTVDNHVALLRSKLEDDPSAPRRLLTVHGVGYKFVRE